MNQISKVDQIKRNQKDQFQSAKTKKVLVLHCNGIVIPVVFDFDIVQSQVTFFKQIDNVRLQCVLGDTVTEQSHKNRA